jgi:hypothetical protein
MEYLSTEPVHQSQNAAILIENGKRLLFIALELE